MPDRTTAWNDHFFAVKKLGKGLGFAEEVALLKGRGKSLLVKNQLSANIELSFNLLDQSLLLRVLGDPTLIRKEIELKSIRNKIVFIDEVQKGPALMDEVH